MFTTIQSPSEIAQLNPQVNGLFKRYSIDAEALSPLKDQTDCAELIVLLCNQLATPEVSDMTSLEKVSLTELVDYLKRSHTYYSTRKLPEIIQGLQHMLKNSEQGYGILHTAICYLEDYAAHLNAHFTEEESDLFPLALVADKSMEYVSGAELLHRFEQFEAHSVQHEIIDSLNYHELVNSTLDLYKTNSETSFLMGVIHEQLNTFRKDVELHEWIEEAVLIPKLKRHLQSLTK